ncbi:MAG: transcriptional repressor LexA [Planctomycetales bacterium]|nr:transcriptional repressor LexA [Planctomycetales bacterium]
MATYTRKQHEILKFVVDYQARHEGLSPTLGEIAEYMDVSKVTIFEHLRALEAKGAIASSPRKSRSVKVLDKGFAHSPGTYPLLGRIAAGSPIEAVEAPESFSITELLPAGQGLYVLEVRGDSMKDEGIHDRDFVFVRQAAQARDGDTVVAVIGENEATLKRYYKESGRVRLQPANETMAPIYVDRCEIRGVVVGVFRRL